MIELEAGLPPHVITRPCRDGIEAEWWARELIARGFAPVILDGVLFLGADAAERDVEGQAVPIIRRFDPSVRQAATAVVPDRLFGRRINWSEPLLLDDVRGGF